MDYLTTATILIHLALISILLFLIIPLYRYLPLKRKKTQLSIRPCPNPNCIRCQNYNRIHISARQRLSHLLRHNYDKKLLERVVRGVHSKPPTPKHSLLCIHWNRILQIIRRIIIPHKSNNELTKNNPVAPTPGQYPTVLLIPGLLVKPIVTDLHPNTISILYQNSSNINTSHEIIKCSTHTTPSSSQGNERETTVVPIYQKLFQEYLQSQFNGKWLINDTMPATAINTNSITTNTTLLSTSCWEVFHLLNQGRWIDANIKLCPQTYTIVQSFPGIMDGCMFGNVFFSVIYPGTKIESHCGPCNIRHRMHFTLSTPSSSSKTLGGPILKVNDGEDEEGTKILDWTVGEGFVFDDSLVHEVEYYADDEAGEEVRVVLIVDLWHPDLKEIERNALRDLFPAV